jgi:hypothetical protein
VRALRWIDARRLWLLERDQTDGTPTLGQLDIVTGALARRRVRLGEAGLQSVADDGRTHYSVDPRGRLIATAFSSGRERVVARRIARADAA